MYDTFSSDYDRFVNWEARLAAELPFLERMLRPSLQDRPPRGSYEDVRVLDAACGTGMHAIALAQRGFQTAGADLSAGMIEQARKNARRTSAAIRFEVAGFGELEERFGTGSFDALLCLGNSLPHVLDQTALARTLEDFAACLRPGGQLLVQNRNFDAVLERRERWMEPQAHAQGDEEWVFLRFYDFREDGLIDFNIVTLRRKGAYPWSQQVTTTRLRPWRQFELAQALAEAGFGDITYYGSMGGEPYNPGCSGNLVIAAGKLTPLTARR